MIGVNLLILMARGPLKSNTKWLGWGKKDEWALVKRQEPKVVQPDTEQPKAEQEEVKAETAEEK